MKKGFTLIELLAVIVVLAILALVVTPIVLNIVENAQTGSDERSLEQYAKLVQSTYYELKMQDPTLTLGEYLSKIDTPEGVSLTYNGSKVVCSEKKVVETVSGTQTIELRNCMVDGRGPYDFINGSAGNKDESSSNSFAEDTWSTIIANVKSGNTSAYKVGDIREISLTGFKNGEKNSDGLYTVRIANMSTPEECSTKSFSQTACGFVVEFVDIISYHQMNPSGEYKGTNYNAGWNKDGWPTSSMYSYVNNDIYNSLPTEVKNAVIPTTVVSGHGKNDSPNKVSTDKLYLLSTAEIWKRVTDSSAFYLTRQLDYYSSMEIVTSDEVYSELNKQYNGRVIAWWIRSTYAYNTSYFFTVYGSGSSANSTYGVAPAFRIG